MVAPLDLIVPQHNHSHLTVRLLAAIPAFVRVILVDNGSTNEHYLAASGALRPSDITVPLPQNQGYTKAINAGLEHATAPYVGVQDNDTVPPPGTYEELLNALRTDPGLGMVGPLLSNSHSPQHFPFKNGDHTITTGMLTTTCAILRREALTDVAPLDEAFYAYGVDNDLSTRLIKAGWHLGIVQAVTVHHDHHVTTRALIGDDGMNREGERALRLLKEKHG